MYFYNNFVLYILSLPSALIPTFLPQVLCMDQGDEHCEVDNTCTTDVKEESSVERDASVDTVSDEILDPVTGCLVKSELVDDEW